MEQIKSVLRQLALRQGCQVETDTDGQLLLLDGPTVEMTVSKLVDHEISKLRVRLDEHISKRVFNVQTDISEVREQLTSHLDALKNFPNISTKEPGLLNEAVAIKLAKLDSELTQTYVQFN